MMLHCITMLYCAILHYNCYCTAYCKLHMHKSNGCTDNVLCSFAGDLEGSELKGGLVAHDHHTQLLRQPTLFQSLHHTHHV